VTPGASGALWANRVFLRLWIAQTLSHVGSQVTLLALPLAALLVFDASAGQVGLVNASQFAPVLVVTPLAGVVADAWSRRRVLILASAIRGALLISVPVLSATGVLRLEHLYAIGFGVGACSALFDVTYQTALPGLVPPRRLVDANSKMQASYSAAQIAGPGLGGLLVQALTAPYALLVGGASFVISALSATGLVESGGVGRRGMDESFLARLTAGLRFILRNRQLRDLVLATAWFNLFEQAVLTVYLIFAARTLSLSAGEIGAAITVGAVGSLGATVVAERIARRLGTGRVLTGGLGLASAAPLLIATAHRPAAAALAVLCASFLLYGFGLTTFNVHSLALRQRFAPPHLLGRVLAGYRFVGFGTIPVGALVGGTLGELVSLRTAILVASSALIAGWALFLGSPLRTLRDEEPVAYEPSGSTSWKRAPSAKPPS
jgi:MFS family permease